MLRSVLFSLFLAVTGSASPLWHSAAIGADISLELLEPVKAPVSNSSSQPLILYLTNLSAPRLGTENDDTILADFRAAGFVIAILDYAHDPEARMPGLARDFVALRSQIQNKVLFADRAIDWAHIFIVPSGCRLKREVLFYHDNDGSASSRTLAMDIIYPSKPARPVGAVLEFSCDNANRMGNFSLDFCTDTLLPSAATEGFAVAMADHPVAAPYRGLDAMPACAWKTKAAVRTLRAEGVALGLNGRIVSAGFSRGSGMALLVATTEGHAKFDHHGEYPEADSGVQGAIIMSGRFTYLDLLPGDKMIPRYTKAWGERATHEDVWRAQGALDYLIPSREAAPLFLTINASESPDALHQMAVLRRRLTESNHPFTFQLESEPRGHKMPLDPAVLTPLFRYLHGRLQ